MVRLSRYIFLTLAIGGCLTVRVVPALSNANAVDTVEASIRPNPRLDANSQRAHEQLLEKARRGRIDVYFEGDSITRRWGATDPQYNRRIVPPKVR
jgi:hypothetical protein